MLLLISGLANNAAAQDGLKDPTQKDKMQKLRNYLESVGINNPVILKFAGNVKDRMEGKYLRLTDYQMESGRIVLHYTATPKISTRQLELKFQPTYSKNTEFVATTRSVMYNYKWNF